MERGEVKDVMRDTELHKAARRGVSLLLAMKLAAEVSGRSRWYRS